MKGNINMSEENKKNYTTLGELSGEDKKYILDLATNHAMENLKQYGAVAVKGVFLGYKGESDEGQRLLNLPPEYLCVCDRRKIKNDFDD